MNSTVTESRLAVFGSGDRLHLSNTAATVFVSDALPHPPNSQKRDPDFQCLEHGE